MRRHPTIAIVNHSTVVSDEEVAHVLRALQRQVTYHFQPYWNAGATLLQVKDTARGQVTPTGLKAPNGKYKGRYAAGAIALAIPAGAWLLVVADDSDQAGALGYHELDTKTIPLGYVFAKTDQRYGLSWTVTASHELLEMLGDPYANQVVQIKQDGTALAYETADAVEADEDGYLIGDVLVSDFVLPEWFVPGSDGPWDYRGLCTGPLEIRHGGYMAVWHPAKGWSQITARVDSLTVSKGDTEVQVTPTGSTRMYDAPRHDEGPRFMLRASGRGLAFGAFSKAPLPEWLS